MIRNWLRCWLGIDDLDKLCAGIIAELVPKESITQLDMTVKSLHAISASLVKEESTLMERSTLAWERIVAIEVEHSALSKKQAELNAILQEVRQLREMLADPKRQPIVARTTHQFRALMEQE